MSNKLCEICAGTGTYGSGEKCYWCEGTGRNTIVPFDLLKHLKSLKNEYEVLNSAITKTILNNPKNLSLHHEKLRNLTQARKTVLETMLLLHNERE